MWKQIGITRHVVYGSRINDLFGGRYTTCVGFTLLNKCSDGNSIRLQWLLILEKLDILSCRKYNCLFRSISSRLKLSRLKPLVSILQFPTISTYMPWLVAIMTMTYNSLWGLTLSLNSQTIALGVFLNLAHAHYFYYPMHLSSKQMGFSRRNPAISIMLQGNLKTWENLIFGSMKAI